MKEENKYIVMSVFLKKKIFSIFIVRSEGMNLCGLIHTIIAASETRHCRNHYKTPIKMTWVVLFRTHLYHNQNKNKI